jgi:hypothetical protein
LSTFIPSVAASSSIASLFHRPTLDPIRTRDEHQYILKTIPLTPEKSYSIQMEFRDETRLIARLKSPIDFSKRDQEGTRTIE